MASGDSLSVGTRKPLRVACPHVGVLVAEPIGKLRRAGRHLAPGPRRRGGWIDVRRLLLGRGRALAIQLPRAAATCASCRLLELARSSSASSLRWVSIRRFRDWWSAMLSRAARRRAPASRRPVPPRRCQAEMRIRARSSSMRKRVFGIRVRGTWRAASPAATTSRIIRSKYPRNAGCSCASVCDAELRVGASVSRYLKVRSKVRSNSARAAAYLPCLANVASPSRGGAPKSHRACLARRRSATVVVCKWPASVSWCANRRRPQQDFSEIAAYVAECVVMGIMQI